MTKYIIFLFKSISVLNIKRHVKRNPKYFYVINAQPTVFHYDSHLIYMYISAFLEK